jgi:predicted restriction endonuclease
VSLPWDGRFPQLGWLRLRDESTPRIAADLGEPSPKRVATTVSRVLRDTRLSEYLKQLHRHTCQLCGTRLGLADGSGYSEGHHLRPLGKPHNGPDVAANVVVLCPNCHALCDLGAIRLTLAAVSRIPEHIVGAEFISYHNDRIFRGSADAT